MIARLALVVLIVVPACARSSARVPDASTDAAIDAALAGSIDAPIDAGLGPTGLAWPPDQVFPSFAAIGSLDVIGTSGRANDVMTLLTSLEGTVNRTRPRIYLDSGSTTDHLWLTEIGAPVTRVDDPLALVARYRGELGGLVITDDALPDTENLACTIAGQTRAIVASPALAATLTAPPYNLPIVVDLRAQHFASKLAVYQYELDHYAAGATHRLIAGLTPDIHGNLRDYAVATGAMMVWLDPRDAAEKAMLAKFLALLSPNSPYLGWWLSEPDGVAMASSYGVPVYAADWSANLTVLGGTPRGTVTAPMPTAAPPLENKVYVAIFMSDGDNLQEDQGLVPLKWSDAARGQVPVGWTVNPGLVDVAPVILRYLQRTATENDVLVSGPSGLGYTYPAAWPSGAFASYTQVTGRYMQAAGLNVITVWNNGADLADADANNFAANIPNLAGLTIQDESRALRWIGGKVPVVRLSLSYGDTAAILESGIDQQLATYTGAAPVFVAVQGNMNMGTIQPGAFADVANHYATNANVVFVRPDHFFQLVDRASHPPQHRVLEGDFDGDHRSDAMFVYAGNGDVWASASDGTALTWRRASNVAGFGNLLDGSHWIATGDLDGDGKTDVLFRFDGDGTWWIGSSNGSTLDWKNAGSTKSAGPVLDGKHRVFAGDYTGDGKTDVLVYSSADGSLSMGVSDGSTLTWHAAGNVANFGNLLDGSHAFFEGDWNGDGKRDLMFYYNGDGHWWMGLSDGTTLTWHLANDSHASGNLLTATHRIVVGDFDGDHETDVMVYDATTGAWSMGASDGSAIAWHAAGTNPAHLLDWSHRLVVGDFDGDGKADVLAYDASVGAWTVGRSDGTTLTWSGAGNVAAYGSMIDRSRLLFAGDYDADGKLEPLVYDSADGSWQMGHSDGTSLAWHLAGNTSGFGDLTH